MGLARKLFRSPYVVSLFIVILIFFGIVSLRNTGNLESLELAAYDWFIRLQPQDSQSAGPIVLIKITENDIRKHGWPLTDSTLAHLLEILTQYRARAIGLDIYRDIPVPPDRDELDSILSRNHHIVMAMKFGDDGETSIPPPPVLKNSDQIGFNDILVDPGGVVRRGLLFLDDGKTTFYSFALRLALLYLQADGITPQQDNRNKQYIRLGETTIHPFETNNGGYIYADARGYQFLLDFKDAQESFPSYSLMTILSGEINPEAVKDKIVLVGYSAEGVKDFFYTPLSRGLQSSQHISGVALHAQIVSQLIRFALNESEPRATTSDWTEWFWILLWCAMGGIMGYMIRSPWRFSLLAVSGLLVLGVIVYVTHISGTWIPLVPPAMGWLITAAVVISYMAYHEKRERIFLTQLAKREGMAKKRKVFIIEMSKEADRIKISGYESMRSEQKTVRHYQEIRVDDERINTLNAEIISLFNRVNQRGPVNREILKKLKSTGQLLYDEIFNVDMKRKLAVTDAQDMIISIDDSLVSTPWELLCDGNSFFCLRFNMGRLVRTRQTISEMAVRRVKIPLKMLIVADPQGTLNSAYREGYSIRDKLEILESTININVISSDIKSLVVLEKIRNFDIFHYAGHADYDLQNPADSGFLMKDGKLKASDIINMIGPKPLPSLVFSNACKSGHTGMWRVGEDYETEIYGLANAFLLAGVQHYIGTFWDVQDETSIPFAEAFYNELMDGAMVGEAVRKARLHLIEKYGENAIIWASYVLYGDPTFSYVDFSKRGAKEGSVEDS
jgi:CHASE2 domain-containing sensor protein/CHAT domain-containing protein